MFSLCLAVSNMTSACSSRLSQIPVSISTCSSSVSQVWDTTLADRFGDWQLSKRTANVIRRVTDLLENINTLFCVSKFSERTSSTHHFTCPFSLRTSTRYLACRNSPGDTNTLLDMSVLRENINTLNLVCRNSPGEHQHVIWHVSSLGEHQHVIYGVSHFSGRSTRYLACRISSGEHQHVVHGVSQFSGRAPTRSMVRCRSMAQHQHVLLVSAVCSGPWRRAARTVLVPRRGQLVEGPRGVYRQEELEERERFARDRRSRCRVHLAVVLHSGGG